MSTLEDDVAARLMEWVDEEYAAAVEIATYPPAWSEDLMYERDEMMRRVEEAPLAYEVLLEWDMEEVVAADHELTLPTTPIFCEKHTAWGSRFPTCSVRPRCGTTSHVQEMQVSRCTTS